MHVDRSKGARSIGVGELDPTSLDSVAVVVRVVRHRGVPLKETPRRIVERASQLTDPGVVAQIRIGLASPESLRVYCLDVRVLDHGDGVAIRTIFDTVDAPRQRDAVLRRIGDVPYPSSRRDRRTGPLDEPMRKAQQPGCSRTRDATDVSDRPNTSTNSIYLVGSDGLPATSPGSPATRTSTATGAPATTTAPSRRPPSRGGTPSTRRRGTRRWRGASACAGW